MNTPVAASAVLAGSNDTVAQHKRELAEGREQLRQLFAHNPSAPQLLRQHTGLVDRILRSVWSELRIPASLALLAVGGYGRGQLFPYSDVDVLILLPDDLGEGGKEQVSDVVGTLWDIGLEIGHSVRTVNECLQEATQD